MRRVTLIALLLGLCLAATPAWADLFQDGQAALRKGDYPEAIRLYSQDLASGKNSPENQAVIYNQRGLAYRRSGKPDLAIADYNRALKLTPSDADLYNNRGIAYKAKGELGRALADYNRAIEINARQANAYFNRSFIHEKQGRIAEAIADVKRYMELVPKDPDGPDRLRRLKK